MNLDIDAAAQADILNALGSINDGKEKKEEEKKEEEKKDPQWMKLDVFNVSLLKQQITHQNIFL